MTWILGVHVGHDASCCLLRDDQIAIAVQEERLTRRKHDGEEALSNRLPIDYCLGGAGISISQVDLIVTSFQSVSHGSFGLHKPLVEHDFSLFDPFDRRHWVISHHYAHALHALGSSGYSSANLIVSDLGGSTTTDGEDYMLPFSEWYDLITSAEVAIRQKTECLSMYRADENSMELLYREFNIPHNQPESFVCSIASLYSNVARRVLGRDHAEGELMGYAAYGYNPAGLGLSVESLITVDKFRKIVAFRNDWQHLVPNRLDEPQKARLAYLCQCATECTTATYCQHAREVSPIPRLALAGGVFLNIGSNRKIWDSLNHASVWVPSAPNDAGIAIGCAYAGYKYLKGSLSGRRVATDRLGTNYCQSDVDSAIGRKGRFVRATTAKVVKIRDVCHPSRTNRVARDGSTRICLLYRAPGRVVSREGVWPKSCLNTFYEASPFAMRNAETKALARERISSAEMPFL